MGLLMVPRSLLCAAGKCSLVIISDMRAYGLGCGEYIFYLLYIANTLVPSSGWLGANLQCIPTC